MYKQQQIRGIIMTLFKGLFLIDIAEEPIGNWENQLGYRGMMEVWKHKETGEEIVIEPFDHEDHETPEDDPHLRICECHEVWMRCEKTGNIDTLGVYDSFDEADREAKKFMRENQRGVFDVD